MLTSLPPRGQQPLGALSPFWNWRHLLRVGRIFSGLISLLRISLDQSAHTVKRRSFRPQPIKRADQREKAIGPLLDRGCSRDKVVFPLCPHKIRNSPVMIRIVAMILLNRSSLIRACSFDPKSRPAMRNGVTYRANLITSRVMSLLKENRTNR